MDAVTMVRISGPLTRFVEGFAAELRSQGYTELSLRNLLHLMSHLRRWLVSKHILVGGLDDAVVRPDVLSPDEVAALIVTAIVDVGADLNGAITIVEPTRVSCLRRRTSVTRNCAATAIQVRLQLLATRRGSIVRDHGHRVSIGIA